MSVFFGSGVRVFAIKGKRWATVDKRKTDAKSRAKMLRLLSQGVSVLEVANLFGMSAGSIRALRSKARKK
jgi:hypothetical protein